MSARFVVFEGGEGSGKTTQIEMLKTTLKTHWPVMYTKQPGGTEYGMAIRKLLLDTYEEKLDPIAELLLFGADRAQHMRCIKENIWNNTHVICDRFTGSTLAYQGYGRGVDIDLLHTINNVATQGYFPDLVVLLDVDPTIGISRANKRGDTNRLDNEELDFHHRVRQGYLDLAHKLDWHIINVDHSSPEEVNTQVLDLLKKKML